MSHNYNPTVNDVRAAVASHVQGCLQGVELDTSMGDNEIEQVINDWLHDQGEANVEVIYNLEAFNIVMGSEFDDYDGSVEMDAHDSPMNAMMAQANSIVEQCAASLLGEEVSELVGSIAELRDHFQELDNSDLEPSIVVSSGSIHGWAAHQYETKEGLSVWTNLESEGIHAIEKDCGSITFSICYTPSN